MTAPLRPPRAPREPRHWLLRGAGLAAGALLLGGAAWAIPSPGAVAPSLVLSAGCALGYLVLLAELVPWLRPTSTGPAAASPVPPGAVRHLPPPAPRSALLAHGLRPAWHATHRPPHAPVLAATDGSFRPHAGSSDLLWSAWLDQTYALPAGLVGPIAETAWAPALDATAPVAPPDIAAALALDAVPDRLPVVGDVAAYAEPQPLGESPADPRGTPLTLLELEALTPTPPHLRPAPSPDPLPTTVGSRPPPAPAAPSSEVDHVRGPRCANCRRSLAPSDPRERCPECRRPICRDCIESDAGPGTDGWCPSCVELFALGESALGA